jgi:hypothetical protein
MNNRIPDINAQMAANENADEAQKRLVMAAFMTSLEKMFLEFAMRTGIEILQADVTKRGIDLRAAIAFKEVPR